MICHTAVVLPSLPDHTWRYSTADDLRHQYPVDAQPDGEGLITAACDQLAFAHLTRLPTASAVEAHCPDCLVLTTADAAHRIAEAGEAGARAQQTALQDGTYNV